ncbi:MAG: FtsX-like permease family protein [Bacteroidales bacterium]|jgi:ABC-type lipoprotein release transport system permease subunit
MLTFKLALRNLLGAGLRTWLNVLVLSLAYVVIIYMNGMLDGWNRQAKTDMVHWSTGQGQLWQKDYDPIDPFTLQNSMGKIPVEFTGLVEEGRIAPVLVAMASFYPEGRIQSILLKGIPENQKVIDLPTYSMTGDTSEIPGIIGKRMAESNKIKVGDMVTLRWRDRNGTFDASDVRISAVFNTNVPMVDAGQIWIPLSRMQKMFGAPGEATILISDKPVWPKFTDENWVSKDVKTLTAEIDQVIKTKSIGSAVMYIILLLLAMLAIFDTQVLSIFRRQREIGTQIALGMTRWQVVRLFTIEGAMNAVLAAALAAVYGIPFLASQAKSGIPMPQATDSMGLAIAEKIFPVYSIGLIIITIVFVLITATIVSYIPARRIAKMNPTEAIKGRIQ